MSNKKFHIFNGCDGLSDRQKHLLSMGLKFSPCPPTQKDSVINDAITKLQRRIQVHSFFNQLPSRKNQRLYDPRLKIPTHSHWKPPFVTKEAYFISNKLSALFKVAQKIDGKYYDKEKGNAKLTKDWKALMNIPTAIKIVSSDKNVGLVALPLKMYHTMVLSHLSQDTSYKKLQKGPFEHATHCVRDKYKRLCNMTLSIFSSYTSKYLTTSLPFSERVPIFHVLPKIHKMTSPIDYGSTPASRPIVASLNWLTTPFSKALSTKLETISCFFPNVVKNSFELVTKLEGESVHDSVVLLTADANSLYTNIPQDLLIDYSKQTWREYNSDEEAKDQANFIACIVEFVIRNNFFTYNKEFYQQINGIAMGTNAAVHLANLFLNFSFDKKIASHPEVLYYFRYIDDILILFDNSKNSLHTLTHLIQTSEGNIFWTIDSPSKEVSFLDTTIFIKDNKISFKIFQKDINIYSYLPFHTYHDKNVLKGFIKGELIRYIRLSTSVNDFFSLRKLFWSRLKARGYSEYFLEPIFASISYSQRQNYLIPKSAQPSENIKLMPFIVPFSRRRIHKTLRNGLHQLSESKEAKTLGIKLLTAYKQPKNVFQLSCKSALTDAQIRFLQETSE